MFLIKHRLPSQWFATTRRAISFYTSDIGARAGCFTLDKSRTVCSSGPSFDISCPVFGACSPTFVAINQRELSNAGHNARRARAWPGPSSQRDMRRSLNVGYAAKKTHFRRDNGRIFCLARRSTRNRSFRPNIRALEARAAHKDRGSPRRVATGATRGPHPRVVVPLRALHRRVATGAARGPHPRVVVPLRALHRRVATRATRSPRPPACLEDPPTRAVPAPERARASPR